MSILRGCPPEPRDELAVFPKLGDKHAAMSLRAAAAVFAIFATVGCASRPARPSGPPPEYEEPPTSSGATLGDAGATPTVDGGAAAPSAVPGA